MSNATTYSNPKEMLGYLIVQWVADMRTTAKLVYYERNAAKTLLFEIDMLDSQVSTFRQDMKIQVSRGVFEDYWETMEKIKPIIVAAEDGLQYKDYAAFREGVKTWLELIASAYPNLGLVPETGEIVRAFKEDNVMEVETNEPIPGVPTDDIGEPSQSIPERGGRNTEESDHKSGGNYPRKKFREL